MSAQQIVRIDKIKWWITTLVKSGARVAVPLCPDHDLKMTEYPEGRVVKNGHVRNRWASEALKLECAEGPHFLEIPREYEKQKTYVLNRIDAKVFKGMKTIDLDGELTPITKEKVKSTDGKYFVTAQLMESKRGLQLAVYAGEKGKTEKTQIFIEPETRRLAFDQKDLNPNDVFAELKATFIDGSSHQMRKGSSK